MKNKLERVLIMAGGTGGHVYPALAVAALLRQRGVEVHWLGTRQGIEARLVPDASISIHYISIGGLRGKSWKTLLMAPWRLLRAIMQSVRIIQQVNPDVILGLGGFASGPGGIASRLLGKKLIIHEQNAKPGLTNACLAHVATKVLEGFPGTFRPHKKVITTGNPVRHEITSILKIPSENLTASTKMNLLVLGGSLGAQAINLLLPRALALLTEAARPAIYHQTGEKFYAETLKAYEQAGLSAEVVPYIHDMAKAYQWADIVLCRAGASTIAELCAAGVGAILVPFPYATGDHQTANANFMVKGQAGILIQQADLTPEWLANKLNELSHSPEKRLQMAMAAYGLRLVNATEKVVEICEETSL